MTSTTDDTMPVGTMSGTPQVLLAHHLKQLKLPTVLREYEKVARECARDGVDHPRYLLRLIELELIDRERRTVERRIRAARFPATKSLDTFDFTARRRRRAGSRGWRRPTRAMWISAADRRRARPGSVARAPPIGHRSDRYRNAASQATS